MSARVKHFSSALPRALREERHFALLDGVAFSNRRLARNRFQVRNSVRPMHLFGRNFDHDYYFELPCEGERDTQSITRCSTTHHRDFRAVLRANRTFSTARNPIPAASSSTDEPPACGPSRPWRFSVLAASSSEDTCCATPARCAPSPAPLLPTRNASSNCLACDVPQSSPIPTGIFQWHQPQIARHLLAASKAFGLANDQHEGQRG